MISSRSVANAVGAKTARPCDSCMKKRARWYCAADDAFLCQTCDSTVHYANTLARRHERVRLKSASSSSSSSWCLKPLDLLVVKKKKMNDTTPSWHKGFTRKARTPRGKHATTTNSNKFNPVSSLVPEMGCDDLSNNEENHNEEEQLLYRVPIFDPCVAELCSNSSTTSTVTPNSPQPTPPTTTISDVLNVSKEAAVVTEAEGLHGFSPISDMDHAEFAADVETLLGKGMDSESFGMEELGFIDCDSPKQEEDDHDHCMSSCNNHTINDIFIFDTGEVKLEEEVVEEEKKAIRVCIGDDTPNDQEPLTTFDLSFDDDDHQDYNNNGTFPYPPHKFTSEVACEEERVLTDSDCSQGQNGKSGANYEEEKRTARNKKRNILLSLDYEGVITAWASQGSPWTSGHRPDFDPEECWPNCMGTCGIESHSCSGHINGRGHGGPLTVVGDGGREARVSRYREKRRTRLFAKKIRYEVRKLNAEKRPRMKGRFVKRATTLCGGPPSFPSLNK